jgi:UbiD family decarboxylase
MEKQGQVLHIKDGVSTKHEISSIMNAFPDGPVLFFEDVEGYPSKVVGNICNTREKITQALGVSPEGLYRKLRDALQSPKAPKIVDDGSVKEVSEAPKLFKIPVLTHFEKDAGAYITSGVISARRFDGKIEMSPSIGCRF